MILYMFTAAGEDTGGRGGGRGQQRHHLHPRQDTQAGRGAVREKTVILKFKFSWESLYVCFVKKIKPQ